MLINFVEKEKRVKIQVLTNEFLDVGSILEVSYKDIPRYFKVSKIQTSLDYKNNLILIAENYGYYNLLSDVDIRDLLALDIKVVKDENIIKKIKKEGALL